MEAEEYNEFGEIIKREKPEAILERRLNSHEAHRIHTTKDIFDGECYLCQKAAKQFRATWWGDDT